jgi:hypothetical protein
VTLELQCAKANLPAHYKDEDTVFVHRLPDENGWLLGVADGISNANGREAAQWIAQTMAELAQEPDSRTWDARGLFDRFCERLSVAAGSGRLADSHSTLSCGIARCKLDASTPFVRVEFFGIGDSPIWRVVPTSVSGLKYQASVAYGPPVPSELSGLYSWVNLGHGRVHGSVHFGSVDIQEGELLIIATDGVPESRVLIQDQDEGGESPRLIERLLYSAEIDDSMLQLLLQGYDDRRLLIDDDASLAVLRLAEKVSAAQPASDARDEPDSLVAAFDGVDELLEDSVSSTSASQGGAPLIVKDFDLEVEGTSLERGPSRQSASRDRRNKTVAQAQEKRAAETLAAAITTNERPLPLPGPNPRANEPSKSKKTVKSNLPKAKRKAQNARLQAAAEAARAKEARASKKAKIVDESSKELKGR